MRLPRVPLTWLLGAVTILASLMFVVSVVSLTRIIRMSSEQRLERGRDLVQRELSRWEAEHDLDGGGTARTMVVGLRGGLTTTQPLRAGLTPEVDQALNTLVTTAAGEGTVFKEVEGAEGKDGTIMLGARRRPDGRLMWAAYSVGPPRFADTWRQTVIVLSLATVLLGAIALVTVVGTTRGARALKRSLAALEQDLSAEVARPAIVELAGVADGVSSLARSLAESQHEREALAGELRRSERLAALGRVVAGLAHEVRNPLAAMKLRVDVARGTDSVPPEVVTELEAVDEEIARLERLVTDFLVVSGRRLGRRVDSDLGEIARRRASLLAPWARERGISLAVAGSAHAHVDPDACARAVDNLLKNAIEASPAGAEVSVRVTRRDEGAALDVEDRGPGVPEARVVELFEPFFTTKPDGTGLGLAVSRAIAVASGGHLSYQREEGVTRFALSLPSSSSGASPLGARA
ncbi:sensor histidine kinase [Chondromyces apiculatus]|uniref:histidine kinase n=1 Tax=Chondromyces apiculatus DSM 436 TaxID=1192034 RepID=A0A017T464_9BACT|nr:HAMP domain-containing sensor histidine kinase [Chondromyces apiculatus]EYF03802.1 signal transduction histidine kinase, nitrogen specific, NtrB [Chondromyces apiculatus DSM 436]